MILNKIVSFVAPPLDATFGLVRAGVAFQVLDLPRDYLENSPSSQLISTTLAAITEFETARRKERQRQGIEAANEKNKYTGRKSVINKDRIKTVEKYKDLGVSVTEIARITGKSRSTIYKVLKEKLGYISNRLVKNDKNSTRKAIRCPYKPLFCR